MEELLYIILGWLFGLLSPTIISKIGEPYRKRRLFKAISSELNDLKFRAALANFRLVKGYGQINSEYLEWLRSHIEDYKGNEPTEATLGLVSKLLECDDNQLESLGTELQENEGVGVSLKTYNVSFLNSHIENVELFPINLQTIVHELLNLINIHNQEVVKANEVLMMTFDSSMSNENHVRLKSGLKSSYINLSTIYKRIINKIDNILEYEI